MPVTSGKRFHNKFLSVFIGHFADSVLVCVKRNKAGTYGRVHTHPDGTWVYAFRKRELKSNEVARSPLRGKCACAYEFQCTGDSSIAYYDIALKVTDRMSPDFSTTILGGYCGSAYEGSAITAMAFFFMSSTNAS